MSPLKKEALWALHTLLHGNHISEKDAALLFVSWNQLDDYLNHLNAAWNFPSISHAIAIKTQPHPGVLKHIVERGFGLEAATWEEVQLALQAGCPPERIVFDSPVKRIWEIQQAATFGKGMLFNANSIEELERLEQVYPHCRIGLRINPLVNTNAPDAFDVSKLDSKFGVPISQLDEILAALVRFPVETLHVHASSSMTTIDAPVEAVCRIITLAEKTNEILKEKGLNRSITTIDIGGGLMPEKLPQPPELSQMRKYVMALQDKIPTLKQYHLITEFGQWVHYHTGYAYSEIEYVTKTKDSQMAFIHLGADLFLRDVYLQPRAFDWVAVRNGTKLSHHTVPTSIAGPLCFANDFLAKKIDLPHLQPQDGLLLLGTGANAFGLWSRHTSRTIPAVFGVDYQQQKIEKISHRDNPFLRNS